MNFRNYIILLSTILLLSCNDNSQRMAMAQERIELNLRIIESHLKGVHDSTLHDPTLDITKAIYFLEDCSGIDSEADGTKYGKLNPTKNDLNRWKSWYEVNRDQLYWDKEDQKIIISSD